MAKRLAGRYGYPKDVPFKVTLHPNRISQPLEWKGNHMIFVCSMSDLFHEDVPDDYVYQILDVVAQAPNHTFQILTKREERLIAFSRKISIWPQNVWLGVTVESSAYKYRIEALKEIKSAVRFLSCEPLLDDLGELDLEGIDWVIVGGESGPKARPMHPRWVKKIKDQCQKERIPFFFKQWGGVRKKAAGRSLEGREWNQMPPLCHNADFPYAIANPIAGNGRSPAPFHSG